MTSKSKKQFGVWMDSHHATIVGKQGFGSGEFVVLGHVENAGADKNSNEKTSNNHEIGLLSKFFKEIANIMPNIDEIHVTGTGKTQEQFLNFLSVTPQYRTAVSSESTSVKMSDENFATFIKKRFD